MRITHRVAAVGATVALSSALALGATGTASAATGTASAATGQAAPATSQAGTTGTTVSMPVELAACHRVWHPGAWYWWNHGGWDWRHPWLHRWERKQHPGWWDCR